MDYDCKVNEIVNDLMTMQAKISDNMEKLRKTNSVGLVNIKNSTLKY